MDESLNTSTALTTTLSSWRDNSIQKTISEVVNVTGCEEFRQGKFTSMGVIMDNVNEITLYYIINCVQFT